MRILTEEVPRGPVLVREGHVKLPVLLHQSMELPGRHLHQDIDACLVVQYHLVVVVVVVVQGPDGRLGLSLEPLPSSIARDADTRASFATTVHPGG